MEKPNNTSERPEKVAGRFLNGIFVRTEEEEVFRAAKSVSKYQPVNILIVGQSGYGKTSIPEAFAREWGVKFVRVNCAQVRDPEEWFGIREARQGTTTFVPSDFTEAVRGGNAVICLDEFNRVETWLHNTLYPLLDHAHATRIHGEDIVVGENTLFAMTINTGYRFTGTFSLDAALLNRMDFTVRVSQLPKEVEQALVARNGLEESLSSTLVEVMRSLRDVVLQNETPVDVSTRTSLKVARAIGLGGMNPYDAFIAAIVNGLSAEKAKPIVDVLSANKAKLG